MYTQHAYVYMYKHVYACVCMYVYACGCMHMHAMQADCPKRLAPMAPRMAQAGCVIQSKSLTVNWLRCASALDACTHAYVRACVRAWACAHA